MDRSFGFCGATLVLGLDIGSNIPFEGLITIIALISITLSTIWQKLSRNLPLVVSNSYQAFGGCLFHILGLYFLLTIHKF